MKIRTEDSTTYTVVCGPLLDKMKPYIEAQGLEYEELPSIPDCIEKAVMLGDRKKDRGICCIKSNMNSDDVHQLMHRVWAPMFYGKPEDD